MGAKKKGRKKESQKGKDLKRTMKDGGKEKRT